MRAPSAAAKRGVRTTDTSGGHEAETTVQLGIHQEKYLSTRAREQEIHAIVTVEVDGSGKVGPGPGLAEVLVIDCSSSMSWPQEKFRAAKDAATAALRMLPDGTPFAVVQGNGIALPAFPEDLTLRSDGSTPPNDPPPPHEAMPPATAELRLAAERAVHRLLAAGGTSIGTWLDLSRQLLARQSTPIRHVLLLTDGQNVHDDILPLATALDACEGQFICDAWGIGEDWDARELLGITERLHGTTHSARDVSELPDAYRDLTGKLLAKAVPELVIRVECSPAATVRFLKQVYPTEMELTGTPVGADGRVMEFVTRAWGDEARRYQLCLTADSEGRPHQVDMQLAAVGVTIPDGAGAVRLPRKQACVVHWTDDPALSRHKDEQVAHYDAYLGLGRAARKAADAYRRGDTAGAEHHLGAAVAIVNELDDPSQLRQLERLVEILDPVAGRVRLRKDIAAVDFQHLIVSASHSTYGPDSGGTSDPREGPVATMPCPVCRRKVPVTAVFCPRGGHRIERAT